MDSKWQIIQLENVVCVLDLGFSGGDYEERSLLCCKRYVVRRGPDFSDENIASIFRVEE
jgi:hypothetical protein